MAASVDGRPLGSGTGRSKKHAEQQAAREAVEKRCRASEAVYLKSLTMKGFKSFPDRTRLDSARA